MFFIKLISHPGRLLILLISLISVLLLYSCVISSQLRTYEEPVPVTKTDQHDQKAGNAPEDVFINADDLIIPDIDNSRIVEIYKDEIQDNCERKFIDLYNYYMKGELLAAKILFDNLLESLEYQYGDKKVSDLAMLQNFWDEFSDQNIKNSDEDIFDIYQSLYFDEALFTKEPVSNELVVEQRTEAVKVKQNNEAYLYVKEKLNGIFNRFGKNPSEEILRSVYESYRDHLIDRIGVKETYIRSQRYIPFIKKRLSASGLDEIYSYLPGIITSFYNEKKNGGIWSLRDRKIRTDVGASTASVIKELKNTGKKHKTLDIIAAVLEEGEYDLSSSQINGDLNTEDMSDFLALSIILSSPGDHDLKGSEIEGGMEKDYLASYEKYLKDPGQFKTSSSSSSDSKPKYSKSFIRIMYKVRRGDNLDKIADLFGVSIRDLRKWNPRDTSKKYLYPGMQLYIKGYKFQHYRARRGDSIGRICSIFKMKQSDFKKINNLRSNTIYKGRRYIVKKR